MNIFYQKILLTLFLVFNYNVIHCQEYIRYKMSDGSFNGFYTNCIDSITHVKENGVSLQKVYYNGMVKSIAVDSIVDVSFENATMKSNLKDGEYKILEIDSGEGFKKAYVDNRATLIASKNGDFYANDTILLASEYNKKKILLFTDESGEVTRFFDGENYVIFDKDYDIFNVIGDSKITFKKTRSIPKLSLNVFLAVLQQLGESYSMYIFENLDAIQSNPELHSQRLIINGIDFLTTITDLPSYFSSLLALTGHQGLIVLDDFYGGIGNSFMDLINEMYPDYETMQKYKDFYKQKYHIDLLTLQPKEITSNSAILTGDIYTEDNLRGNLYFNFSEVLSGEDGKTIAATSKYNKVNQWDVEGRVSGLKPGNWYIYDLRYECTVDKLKLKFVSEPVDFETPKPFGSVESVNSVTDHTAVAKCFFSDIDEDVYCGVIVKSESQKLLFPASRIKGEQKVVLTGLNPATEYTCYAFVKTSNYYKEQELGVTFKTDLPDISGTWECTEQYYPNIWTQEVKYKSYTLTLNNDGTASCSEYEKDYGGSWSLSDDGTVRISIILLTTSVSGSTDSGVEWEGKLKDMKNPSKIEGYTYRWNSNNAVGYVQGDSHKIIMTK